MNKLEGEVNKMGELNKQFEENNNQLKGNINKLEGEVSKMTAENNKFAENNKALEAQVGQLKVRTLFYFHALRLGKKLWYISSHRNASTDHSLVKCNFIEMFTDKISQKLRNEVAI